MIYVILVKTNRVLFLLRRNKILKNVVQIANVRVQIKYISPKINFHLQKKVADDEKLQDQTQTVAVDVETGENPREAEKPTTPGDTGSHGDVDTKFTQESASPKPKPRRSKQEVRILRINSENIAQNVTF